MDSSNAPWKEVRVSCYAGTRAQQRPRAYRVGQDWVWILRILDYQRISGPDRGDPVWDYYQILNVGGGILWLCRDGERWFLKEA